MLYISNDENPVANILYVTEELPLIEINDQNC